MIERQREQHGSFVITKKSNLSAEGIVCAQCSKLLSKYDQASDTHYPPAEQLFAQGAVPVPNFGWFCSQTCGDAYSTEFGSAFQRNARGKIAYYD